MPRRTPLVYNGGRQATCLFSTFRRKTTWLFANEHHFEKGQGVMKHRGKRLLILNGLSLASDIVDRANSQGIYTIVTDVSEDAPAKRRARESHTVPTTDLDGVVNLGREVRADGIITGFVDSNLLTAEKACRILGLPFYATAEQIKVATNKARFKALCREHGVPVIPEFNASNPQSIRYPVLVKPVDNTGSKGIVICRNEREFAEGYERSLQFSASGKVLVERFMDLTKPGVNLDYVICDGEAHLSAVGDLFCYQGDPASAPVSSAVYYPSSLTDEYVRVLDPKVKDMFRALGMRNGVVFIQAFYEDGQFYLCEMGYRLGGGQSYQVVSHLGGTNGLDMMIDFALTGKMCDEKAKRGITPHFERKGLILILLARPGKIEKVEGFDRIREMPGVVNASQMYEEGQEIPRSALNTTRQSVGRVHFVADTDRQIIQALASVKKALSFWDDEGRPMLLDTFDEQRLRHPKVRAGSKLPSVGKHW